MNLFGKKKDAIGLPRPFDAAEIGIASMVVNRKEVCALSVDDDNEAKRYVLTIVFKNGGSVSRKLDMKYPSKFSTSSLASLFGCIVFGFVNGYDIEAIGRRIMEEGGQAMKTRRGFICGVIATVVASLVRGGGAVEKPIYTDNPKTILVKGLGVYPPIKLTFVHKCYKDYHEIGNDSLGWFRYRHNDEEGFYDAIKCLALREINSGSRVKARRI